MNNDSFELCMINNIMDAIQTFFFFFFGRGGMIFKLTRNYEAIYMWNTKSIIKSNVDKRLGAASFRGNGPFHSIL